MDAPDEDGVMDGSVERRPSAAQPIPAPGARRPPLAHSAPDQPFRHLTAPGSYSLATPKIYTTPSSPSPYSRQVKLFKLGRKRRLASSLVPFKVFSFRFSPYEKRG